MHAVRNGFGQCMGGVLERKYFVNGKVVMEMRHLV